LSQSTSQESLRDYFISLGVSRWNADNSAKDVLETVPETTPDVLSGNMEMLRTMLPGADVDAMVKSDPSVLLAMSDDVNSVMMALSDVLGIDAALVIVEKQPALLRVADMRSSIEITLKKMAEWAPNTDEEYRKEQLFIYPQLLKRVPEFYVDAGWNEIPVDVQNMCSKSMCG